jgi:hypothetical protein
MTVLIHSMRLCSVECYRINTSFRVDRSPIVSVRMMYILSHNEDDVADQTTNYRLGDGIITYLYTIYDIWGIN